MRMSTTNCLNFSSILPPLCSKLSPQFTFLPHFRIRINLIDRVEPTAEPWGWFKTDDELDSIQIDNPPVNLMPSQGVEPSWFYSDEDEFEPQIIGRFAGRLGYRRRRRRTVIVTSTRMTTSIKTETSYTSTKTFAISGCTPSSLPYNYCL